MSSNTGNAVTGSLVERIFSRLACQHPDACPERLYARARYLAEGLVRGRKRFESLFADGCPSTAREAEAAVVAAQRAEQRALEKSQAAAAAVEAVEEAEELEAVLAGKVADVLEFAEHNPADVPELLALEESAEKPRSSLVKGLQDLLGQE